MITSAYMPRSALLKSMESSKLRHLLATAFLVCTATACGGSDDGGATPAADAETGTETDAGGVDTPDGEAPPTPDAEAPPARDATPSPDADTPPTGACGALEVVDFTVETATDDEGSLTMDAESDPAGASTLEGLCGGAQGAEVVFRFVAPEPGLWRFLAAAADPDAPFDTVLYARTECLDAETEVDCNDDLDFPARTDSRVIVELAEGEAVFLVVDAYAGAEDPRGGAVVLNARRIEEVAPTGACDRLSLVDTCGVEDFCFVEADALDPEVGQCVAATPPVVVAGRATNRDGVLGLSVEGTDSSRDTVAVLVTLFQGETVVETLNDGPAEDLFFEPLDGLGVYGEAAFTLHTATELAALVGDVTPDRLEVRLLDSQSGESDVLSLPIAVAAELALGAPCDGLRLHDLCAPGLACRDPMESGLFTCETVTAPTLASATAWYDALGGRLAVEFVGADLEQDVDAPAITVLDAEGVDIPLLATGEIGEALGEFEPFEYEAEGAFRATWLYVLQDDAGLALNVGAVRVRVVDAEGLYSASVEASLVATTRDVPDGEPCDPFGARSTCATGSICDVPEEGEPLCATPVLACPEDWGALPLEQGVAVEGETVDAESHGEGTCGGGAGDRVYVFTAVEGGRYLATAESEDPDADTVLYARSACGYSGLAQPTLELDCNDDRDESTYLSELVLNLEAQQTVYIFVDGFVGESGEGWRGPFTLSIDRAD